MDMYYTSEKHTRILIALMKFHGIRKVVASPGTTNVCVLGSLQNDSYFEIYSSVDERSAAYIACGMAAESKEPVALVCTGATASRNYIPGLTEAFYRHLPILAITTTQHLGKIGNLDEQVIDRSKQLADMVKHSETIDVVRTDEDEWACGIKCNRAMIALKSNGGGPAHINLVTTYSRDFSVKDLPEVKGVKFIDDVIDVPAIPRNAKVAIIVGVHDRWNDRLSQAVEDFCSIYDAIVVRKHPSNYMGRYGVDMSVLGKVIEGGKAPANADIMIHIGGVLRYIPKFGGYNTWRVSPDGKVVDPTRRLSYVFQMGEAEFFERQIELSRSQKGEDDSSYAKKWQELYKDVIARVPELPFSNIWVARETIGRLPTGSVLHMAGSNTARAWSYFDIADGVECYANDGTMGIDGQVSALVGESLITPDRIHFGVCGDLTFFYDMNSIGNRHIGPNLRLIVINNGLGVLFKLDNSPCSIFGNNTDPYLAAAGHFGNKSPNLLRHYAQDLGFEYLSAKTKEEYVSCMASFLDPSPRKKPIVLEVFTEVESERAAWSEMRKLTFSEDYAFRSFAKSAIRAVAGERGISTVKRILGR